MTDKFERLWAAKNKNDEWWSSFVTSPLAIAANYVVVDWKWLSPNLLTLFSFIVACWATILIIIGGQLEFIIAAILIHASHVLDCMDGQMARYRKSTSTSGGLWDRITDQVQVFMWFGAIGYAAHIQTDSILPVFLAFIGAGFYSLRGYIKYTLIYTEVSNDKDYLEKAREKVDVIERDLIGKAGPGYGSAANFRWFIGQQKKVLSFDEGVFIFMLSLGLVCDVLLPVLWVFAVSQAFYGVSRSFQRTRDLEQKVKPQVLTTTEK